MAKRQWDSSAADTVLSGTDRLLHRRVHPYLTGELAIYCVGRKPEKIAKTVGLILAKNRKRFQLPGSSSFCGAFKHADHSPTYCTVALIMSDRPSDFTIPSPRGVPYWREAVTAFRNRYYKVFQMERELDLLPSEFTVISLMPMNRGRLDEEELNEITGPIPELPDLPLNQYAVKSLKEAVLVLTEQVLPSVIRKQDLDLSVTEDEKEDTLVLPAWKDADKPVTGGMHFQRWRDIVRGVKTA